MGHKQELQGRIFGVTNAAIMRLCVPCHTEITGTASIRNPLPMAFHLPTTDIISASASKRTFHNVFPF